VGVPLMERDSEGEAFGLNALGSLPSPYNVKSRHRLHTRMTAHPTTRRPCGGRFGVAVIGGALAVLGGVRPRGRLVDGLAQSDCDTYDAELSVGEPQRDSCSQFLL
jgi:hypothetical protein